MEVSNDYMEEAALRLKEMRLLGWDRKVRTFDLTDTATLRYSFLDYSDGELVDTEVWWVEEREEGAPCSVTENSPEEALAGWLKRLDE